ncbi:MAG: transketolase C-terminal domain-containing protein [Verrucomicrobiae bacterium]|nr:transketolase C-terminal domain-containing protein [Verrucomicrobiae bacterium]
MRNAFASEITALAATDPTLIMMTADIGNRLFDRFKDQFPDRLFNCGVAEANMIGMAAGLASGGFRPICYTITPFITYRCYEQIRVDVCYHQKPVTIVGTGSGLSYASLGVTHHSCEDIAVMRVLPGMTVLCPADAFEVRALLRASRLWNGPVYMRIGKKGEPTVHASTPELTIGKALPIRSGSEVALLSTGNMLPSAMETAGLLAQKGVSCEVVSFHTVKPLDEDYLRSAFSKFKLVATLEEHSILGGLGGSVAEWLADGDGPRARMIRLGTGDHFLHTAGEQEFAREHYGLTPAKISEAILSRLN